MNQHPGMLCDCHHVYQVDINTSLMHSCNIKSYHNLGLLFESKKTRKTCERWNGRLPRRMRRRKAARCVHAESWKAVSTLNCAFHPTPVSRRSTEECMTADRELSAQVILRSFAGQLFSQVQHVFGPTDFPGLQWQVHDHSGSMMQSRHVSDDLTAVCLKVGQF